MTAERDTTAGAIPVAKACELASVSRSWYYDRQRREPRNETDLQDRIEEIVTGMEAYGYRRVTQELHRRGFPVNHKRVLRIMREQSWLCKLVRLSRRTTQSDHGLAVFPNLLPDAVITGPNQAWVADITYIRLSHEFVYLAVVLDAHSRKVVGWNLSRRLDVSLTLTALECALAKRRPGPGVIHHSDRGVQYAAGDYVAKAREAGMVLSMSRRGRPKDNAQAESFFRTLKVEQVYLSEYLDFEDARQQIGHFIEDVYNRKRLHSSLGYMPPTEFEAKLIAALQAGIPRADDEKGHPGGSTVGVPVPELPMAPARIG